MIKKSIFAAFVIHLIILQSEAYAYRWPISGSPSDWEYGYIFAEETTSGRHLGVDIILEPGTPIFAPTKGEIFISKTQYLPGTNTVDPNGYGSYIVAEYTTPNGEKRVFGFGHLSSREEYPRRGKGKFEENDILGYVGFDDENGKGGPHTHWFDYGAPYNSSEYHYWGYAPNSTLDDVDYDSSCNFIGGKFTNPIKLWKIFIEPPSGYTVIKFYYSHTVYLFSNNQLWPIKDSMTYAMLGFSQLMCSNSCSTSPDFRIVSDLPVSNKYKYIIRTDVQPFPSISNPQQNKISYRVVDSIGPNTCSASIKPKSSIYAFGADSKFHGIANWDLYTTQLGFDSTGKDIVDITQQLFDYFGEGAIITSVFDFQTYVLGNVGGGIGGSLPEPYNLTFESSTSSSITLSVIAPAITTSFNINIYQDDGSLAISFPGVANQKNFVTINILKGETLKANTTYYFTATTSANVNNADIESIDSNQVNATTSPASGTFQPENISVIPITYDEIGITWNRGKNSDSPNLKYKIYRDNSSSPIAVLSAPSFYDTGLSESTQYCYSVSAFLDNVDNSESSLTPQVCTTTPSKPYQPLQCTGTITTTQVVTCRGVTPVEGYDVPVNVTSDFYADEDERVYAFLNWYMACCGVCVNLGARWFNANGNEIETDWWYEVRHAHETYSPCMPMYMFDYGTHRVDILVKDFVYQSLYFNVYPPKVNLPWTEDFEQSMGGFILEDFHVAGSMAVVDGVGVNGSRALEIYNSNPALEEYEVQAKRVGLNLKSNTQYSLSFKVKSENIGQIATDLLNNISYNNLGLYTIVKTNNNWQQINLNFTTSDNFDPKTARLAFYCGLIGGKVWVDDISLHEFTPPPVIPPKFDSSWWYTGPTMDYQNGTIDVIVDAFHTNAIWGKHIVTTKDKIYRLKFTAVAANYTGDGVPITINLYKDANPWPQISQTERRIITKDVTSFVVDLYSVSSDANGMLGVNCNNAIENIHFSDISIIEITPDIIKTVCPLENDYWVDDKNIQDTIDRVFGTIDLFVDQSFPNQPWLRGWGKGPFHCLKKLYILTFKASANVSAEISFRIQQNYGQYKAYSDEKLLILTPTLESYRIELPCSTDDLNAMIVGWMAYTAAQYHFENIQLDIKSLPGDVDCDGLITISDAILGLQTQDSSKSAVSQTICADADLNGDGKIGSSEVIYIVQKIAGLRN